VLVHVPTPSVPVTTASAPAHPPPEPAPAISACAKRRRSRKGSRDAPTTLDGPWERGSLAWPATKWAPIDDMEHRKQGLWAIDTVNPNAWPKAADYLKRTSSDFVCVQETGVKQGRFIDDAEQAAKACKWTPSLQPCVVTECGGKSAGVGVAVRNHIGLSKPASCDVTDQYQTPGRFILRRVGAMRKGGVHVGSLYLKDDVGASAKCNLDTLHNVALAVKALKGPWCIGGDWNCTPEELQATGWLKMVGGLIKAPRTSTCNSRTIDFLLFLRT
jgi:exonuclease III